MKKKKIIIIAAIVLAASVGICGALVACNGSGSETGSTESKVEESTEGSVESEKVSEETSSPESSQSESSAESSKDSDKSKQESSRTESSKVESSKESSKSGSTAQVPITSLSLPKSSLKLRVGESVSLEPGVMPSNATERSLVAHYSNSNIAYYDGHTVTANGVGSSTVGISTEDGRYRVDIEVIVSGNSVNSGNSGNTSKSSSTQNNRGSSSKPSGNSSKPSKTQSTEVNPSNPYDDLSWKSRLETYKSPHGLTLYKCTEMLPVINRYRRERGLQELVWDTPEWQYEAGLKYIEHCRQEFGDEFDEMLKEGIFEDSITPDGKYIMNEHEKDPLRGIAESADWCEENHSIAHRAGDSNINFIQNAYDMEAWVADIIPWTGHWEIMMNPKADTFSGLFYYNEERGGYTMYLSVHENM